MIHDSIEAAETNTWVFDGKQVTYRGGKDTLSWTTRKKLYVPWLPLPPFGSPYAP